MPSWPLLLAGPMPRRVESGAVSVFVACKHPRTVRLSVYDGTDPDPGRLLAEHEDHTVALGRFLHVAVVTARPAPPLAPGRIYGYDLGFARTAPAEPGDGGPARADLGSLGLLERLAYEPDRLPSFVTSPERLEQVRIVHGSCRKPHGQRRDALATLDQLLRTTHADAGARPQQLFLTGDQIYADDVEPALLRLAGTVGRAALGWERPEPLPDVENVEDDDFRLAPTRRDHVVRQRGGFTGPVLHSHLMSLAEFYGMYLLIWSEALWPHDSTGNPTLPAPEAVLDHPRWREADNRKRYRRAWTLTTRSRADALEFARTVPRVRRALANVATYMIFDDHDVTDDWNLHRQWRETVERRPLGRRLVQNALAAYAVFQAWGNEPAQFGADQPGGRLLAALAAWDGTEGANAAAIRAGLGLPSPEAGASLRWDYQVDTPCYQAIALDTRTQRGFEPGGAGRAAPALLSEPAMQRQLGRRLADREQEFPVTVVVSAAPVFGHPLIEAYVQLKKLRLIEWLPSWPAVVDREAWSLNPAAFEALLATLVPFGRVVILSGDVHYGFAGAVEYWDWRDGTERRARFVQCTSSALKNEDNKTRVFGGVPTVAQVPAMLGARVEKALARLTTPPSLSLLGWSSGDPRRRLRLPGRARAQPGPAVLPSPLAAAHRHLAPPDWRYRIDFHHDRDLDPVKPPGRSSAEHRRAHQLRAEQGWSFMHTIVGRNNLGDIEFLPTSAAEPAGTPDLVRQSLWFDKTSIRSGSEPERLPYTVYDLPLTLPDETPRPPRDHRRPVPRPRR